MQSSRGDRDEDRRDRGDRDRNRDRDRGDRGDRGERGERRRSRSPHHRSSRREGEVDSYSSSRDYRAREREDRYGGHGRRDDREWDRDRGDRALPRRDERRDLEERPRRDRDLFDDRRGGGSGRGGRGDRDAFQQNRKKSISPPPKKKEPTPDLTEVVPILERKRRLTQWDIKPPGYENVTAEQAKLSGTSSFSPQVTSSPVSEHMALTIYS